jgi:hypothetical protein
MIDKTILRSLVLEVFKKTPRTQATSIINDVERLVKERDLFPRKDECERLKVDYNDYQQKHLNPTDRFTILEVIWDMVSERIVTPGLDQSNVNFPFVSLTSFGEHVISQSTPHYYDPDGYIMFLKGIAPNLDPVIEQYVLEGVNCFRRQLLFASAVMLGAAAEKAVLILLEAIAKATNDPRRKKEVEHLLEGARLPTVYDKILDTLTPLTKSGRIPYSIHQGCSEHLMSLFEMIRVQRNDAVHPEAGIVSKDKVFLSLQTLPVAIGLVYGLIGWLESNSI